MDTTSAAAAGIAPHNTNNAALLSQDDTQAFQPHEFPFADDLVLAGANDGWEIDRETVQEGMVPAPTDSHLAWQCEGAAGRNDDVANGCSAAPVTAHTPVHESGVVRVHSAPTQAVSTVRAREPRPVVDIDRFMSGSSVLVRPSSSNKVNEFMDSRKMTKNGNIIAASVEYGQMCSGQSMEPHCSPAIQSVEVHTSVVHDNNADEPHDNCSYGDGDGCEEEDDEDEDEDGVDVDDDVMATKTQGCAPKPSGWKRSAPSTRHHGPPVKKRKKGKGRLSNLMCSRVSLCAGPSRDATSIIDLIGPIPFRNVTNDAAHKFMCKHNVPLHACTDGCFDGMGLVGNQKVLVDMKLHVLFLLHQQPLNDGTTKPLLYISVFGYSEHKNKGGLITGTCDVLVFPSAVVALPVNKYTTTSDINDAIARIINGVIEHVDQYTMDFDHDARIDTAQALRHPSQNNQHTKFVRTRAWRKMSLASGIIGITIASNAAMGFVYDRLIKSMREKLSGLKSSVPTVAHAFANAFETPMDMVIGRLMGNTFVTSVARVEQINAKSMLRIKSAEQKRKVERRYVEILQPCKDIVESIGHEEHDDSLSLVPSFCAPSDGRTLMSESDVARMEQCFGMIIGEVPGDTLTRSTSRGIMSGDADARKSCVNMEVTLDFQQRMYDVKKNPSVKGFVDSLRRHAMEKVWSMSGASAASMMAFVKEGKAEDLISFVCNHNPEFKERFEALQHHRQDESVVDSAEFDTIKALYDAAKKDVQKMGDERLALEKKVGSLEEQIGSVSTTEESRMLKDVLNEISRSSLGKESKSASTICAHQAFAKLSNIICNSRNGRARDRARDTFIKAMDDIRAKIALA